MSSLNRVALIGALGADPEIRYTQGGDAIASFSLATKEVWKEKNTGEKKERTEWHKVVIFNKNLVSLVQSYIKKGSKLYIEGMLQTRKWQDKDGNDRYTTEVVLKNYVGQIVMLGGGNGINKAVTPSQAQAFAQAPANLDDEIPF